MKRILGQLLGGLTARGPRRTRRSALARLEVEALETRDVPSALSVVPDAGGAPTVYTIGLDHQVYKQMPTGYARVAPGYVTDLQTIRDAANNPSVYVLGGDHQIYVLTPAGYGLTNPGYTIDFTLTRDPRGTTVVYALGGDHQVYRQTTHGYVLAGLGQFLSIRATQDGGNNPVLFAMGYDHVIYQLSGSTFVPAAGGQALDFDVTRYPNGNPALFIIGIDRQVYFSAGGRYQLVDSGQALGLRAAQAPDGMPIAYILGLDQQVYIQQPGSWGLTVPGPVLGFERSFEPSGNNLIFAVGMDHQVYIQTPVGYALTEPGFLGSSITSAGVGAFQTLATGAGAGGGPDVKVFDAATNELKFSFFAYDPRFTGGVRVAVGDVNGDGMPDVITAPGPGGGPDTHVYDGRTGLLLRQFWAFDSRFTGGVYVASADVNGDGYDDIIVGADAGGGPNVRVFSGKDGSVLQNFMAFNPAFTGGVRVAAGDTNGDGYGDVVVGAGPGGGPSIGIFSGRDGTLLRMFNAANGAVTSGVQVAAGDTNADGCSDIVAGVGGDLSQVVVFSGLDGSILQTLRASMPTRDGVRVAALNRLSDGLADVVMGPGPGAAPSVLVEDGRTQEQIDAFFAYDPRFTGGLYVASGQTNFARGSSPP